MSTLKEHLTTKLNLTEDEADQVVTETSNYLKSRLPGLLHRNIEDIFQGKSLESGIKERLNELGGEINKRTGSLANDLKEAMDKTFGSTKK